LLKDFKSSKSEEPKRDLLRANILSDERKLVVASDPFECAPVSCSVSDEECTWLLVNATQLSSTHHHQRQDSSGFYKQPKRGGCFPVGEICQKPANEFVDYILMPNKIRNYRLMHGFTAY
jgi:hypothetical protein